jgi:hypothetical protein
MVTGYPGTYRATVVDNNDPMLQDRLLVIVPEVYGSDTSVWAVGSRTSASTTVPSVGDLVWVSFEHGDTDYPVWQFESDDSNAARGYVGKYRGMVLDNLDPLQENRLSVTVPEVDPSSAWALPSDDVRYTASPDVGAQVWIEYDNGDPAYPRWVGLA